MGMNILRVWIIMFNNRESRDIAPVMTTIGPWRVMNRELVLSTSTHLNLALIVNRELVTMARNLALIVNRELVTVSHNLNRIVNRELVTVPHNLDLWRTVI